MLERLLRAARGLGGDPGRGRPVRPPPGSRADAATSRSRTSSTTSTTAPCAGRWIAPGCSPSRLPATRCRGAAAPPTSRRRRRPCPRRWGSCRASWPEAAAAGCIRVPPGVAQPPAADTQPANRPGTTSPRHGQQALSQPRPGPGQSRPVRFRQKPPWHAQQFLAARIPQRPQDQRVATKPAAMVGTSQSHAPHPDDAAALPRPSSSTPAAPQPGVTSTASPALPTARRQQVAQPPAPLRRGRPGSSRPKPHAQDREVDQRGQGGPQRQPRGPQAVPGQAAEHHVAAHRQPSRPASGCAGGPARRTPGA